MAAMVEDIAIKHYRLSPIDPRIERIHHGHRPRVLDLFSGCGGLSLGFLAAGFDITCSVEIEPHAAHTHDINFAPKCRPNTAQRSVGPRDIIQTGPAELANEIAPNERHDSVFDIIIGGPPCQAFARVGRAKLREVAALSTAVSK